MTQTHEDRLPIPNPEDWTDLDGAAKLLGKSRPTVYALIEKGVLTRYEIGCHAMLWVPEVKQAARAFRVLAVRRG